MVLVILTSRRKGKKRKKTSSRIGGRLLGGGINTGGIDTGHYQHRRPSHEVSPVLEISWGVIGAGNLLTNHNMPWICMEVMCRWIQDTRKRVYISESSWIHSFLANEAIHSQKTQELAIHFSFLMEDVGKHKSNHERHTRVSGARESASVPCEDTCNLPINSHVCSTRLLVYQVHRSLSCEDQWVEHNN